MFQVSEAFNSIQEQDTINNKTVYSLLDSCCDVDGSSEQFIQETESCFLRVMKTMVDTRKRITKYDKFSEKFFGALYFTYIKGHFDAKLTPSHKESPKISKGEAISTIFSLVVLNDLLYCSPLLDVFKHFLGFFSEGLLSPNLHVKTFAANQLIGILKSIPADQIPHFLSDDNLEDIVSNGTIHLIETKNRSLQLLGLTIAFYLQSLDREDIRFEILKCMANEEKDDIRKAALRIISLNEDNFEANFPEFLVRSRDLNSINRSTFYRRLTSEKILLANMHVKDIYRLVYDGLGSRELGVREDCIAYLVMNYHAFASHPQSNGSDLTHGKKTRINFLRFMKMFQVERTLKYPSLYQTMDDVMKIAATVIIPSEELAFYLRDILQLLTSHDVKEIQTEEVYLVRILAFLTRDEQSTAKSSLTDVASVLDDKFPNGSTFADVVKNFHKKKDLFSNFQILLLSGYLINCDEIGRQKLKETLRDMCLDINTAPWLEAEPLVNESDWNDIFKKHSDESLHREKMFRNDHGIERIIEKMDDLMFLVVDVLKKLTGTANANAFSIFLLEIISTAMIPLKDCGEEELSLMGKQDEIISNLATFKSNLHKVEAELAQLKKLKPAQQKANAEILFKLEKTRDAINKEIEELSKQEAKINRDQNKISRRCLHLTSALLQHCSFGLVMNSGVNELMTVLITPCFQHGNEEIKVLALRCLALFVLLDKTHCLNFLQVFAQNLEEGLEDERTGISANSFQLVSMKALFDFALVHDIFKLDSLGERIVHEDADDEQGQKEILTYEDLSLTLSRYMFQGDLLSRTLCIEGYAKLLFHSKVSNPLPPLVYLMILWRDLQIIKSGGYEAIQILSVFFKQYRTIGFEALENLERAFEIYLLLLLRLFDDRGMEFNRGILLYEVGDVIHHMVTIAIRLLSSVETSNLLNERLTPYTPLERFFIFLCKLCNGKFCAAYRTARILLEKVILSFDFIGKSEHSNLILSYLYLEEVASSLEENKKNITKFVKELQRSCSAAKNNNTNNKSAMTVEGEGNTSILSSLTEIEASDVKAMKTTLEDEFSRIKGEFISIFKELKTMNIVVRRPEGVDELFPHDVKSQAGLAYDYEFGKVFGRNQENDGDEDEEGDNIDDFIEGRSAKKSVQKRRAADLTDATNKPSTLPGTKATKRKN